MKSMTTQDRLKVSKELQYDFDNLIMFEAIEIKATSAKGNLPEMHWLITRVPGGWIYEGFNPAPQYPTIIFVPKL